MTSATTASANTIDLVERLTKHRTLGGVPRHELEWLAARGALRHLGGGYLYMAKGELVSEMVILFTGRIGVYTERGTGRRHLTEFVAGDATGLLPYSRASASIGDIVIEEPTEFLSVHPDHFPEMIRDCPVLTATLVHVMVDRARQFVSTDWQDEKMMSLGRLSASIAHELNNPASAAARSAKLLADALTEMDDAANVFGAAALSEEQRLQVAALRHSSLIPATTGVFSAIERADREDEIIDWLNAHHADAAPASALTESGVTREALDEVADALPGEALNAALRWVAAGFTARSLATDVQRATSRIYDLVSAVKRFTYMDRATVKEPTDVAQGLADTVSVMAAKARTKSVAVKLDVAPGLPRVPAYTGELNQVWANLIDNAIDAAGRQGVVSVIAKCEGNLVVVRIVDDGPGIPPDVRSRIFDPFFTTKPIGEGTGLGLDISRRIVREHDGQIEFETRPGRTEFRVSVPVERSKG